MIARAIEMVSGAERKAPFPRRTTGPAHHLLPVKKQERNLNVLLQNSFQPDNEVLPFCVPFEKGWVPAKLESSYKAAVAACSFQTVRLAMCAVELLIKNYKKNPETGLYFIVHLQG